MIHLTQLNSKKFRFLAAFLHCTASYCAACQLDGRRAQAQVREGER